ncbi:unnamed protein product [Urochloa decumbens]|uniref:Farnesyl pyrophosphate synthase n=1 Tax=Urochloa decumbens TaxID=240449 RepID=A0ABC9B1Y6_9POAL
MASSVSLQLINSASSSSTGTLEADIELKVVLHDEAATVGEGCRPPPAVDDCRERFMKVYERLRDELVADDYLCKFAPNSREGEVAGNSREIPTEHADFLQKITDKARRWVKQAMSRVNLMTCKFSNTSTFCFEGKLNRGLSVVESYMLLKRSKVTEDEFFLACVLGWCVEWFQACALVLDDITDDALVRRDKDCWFRRSEVGLHGINDGVLLKCHIARLLKKYFREKHYYVELSELWDEIALQTSLGQMLDLISTHDEPNDVEKYNIQAYRRIVKYKTSYYSFYLPVACALLLYGAKLENFSGLRDILIEMGIYFQAQDDYLDCFEDPHKIGKIGTDIEDHKCSWLVVEALGQGNINQIEELVKNYGQKDQTSVSKVKSTYLTLDLKEKFFEYEDRAYKHLVSSIEAQRDRAVQEILNSFLKKIHRRKK